MTLLDIKKIRLDGGTQHRVKGLNKDFVEAYTEAYLDGDKFPNLIVVFDGTNYWLVDGFHRIAAARQAGMKGIGVDITRGTVTDAFDMSLSSPNKIHGFRWSNDDKRAAVISALQAEHLKNVGDREIARRVGVSQSLVSGLRNPKQLSPKAGNDDKVNSKITPELSGNTSENDYALEENAVDSGPDLSQDNSKRKKRGRPPKQAAKPEVDDSEPADPEPPAPSQPKPRVVPLGSLEDITRERDEFRDRVIELGQMCEELTDEVAALLAVTSTDDQVTAALEECRKERGLRRVAEERINGLMNEKGQAVKAANTWKDKYRRLERSTNGRASA